VGFLRRGFLKLSSFAGWGWGCPLPVALGVISPSCSHSEKYGFGPSLEMVVSDGEDGDFWDEDGEFPYHLGDFSLATLLDWALVGDEGIEDTLQKVKDSRELLNSNCSINYDAKGVHIGVGKARLTLVSV
jgi:hypothetical protein